MLITLKLGVRRGRIDVNAEGIVNAFKAYVEFQELSISQNDYMENMEKKMNDKVFTEDIKLLIRPEINYNQQKAYQLVKEILLLKL